MPLRPLLIACLLATLAGCDQLGIESASVTAARIEADGKAVGAGCRHGGRAIEDCFALNRHTDKAAIYAGWREMDDYMRENKIEPVPPTLGPDASHKTASDDTGDDAAARTAGADKPADKASDAKPGTKSARADKPSKGEKTAAAGSAPAAD